MFRGQLGVLVACAAVVGCGRGSRREAGACLQIGAPVRLTGVFADTQAYGPPGFGENPAKDAKWQLPILVLNEPISICAGTHSDSSGSAMSSVSRVELDLSKDLSVNLPPIGQRIMVHGRLERRSVMSQITD